MNYKLLLKLRDLIKVDPPQLLHKNPPRLLLKPPPIQTYGPFVELPKPIVPARRDTSVADPELPPAVAKMNPGELPVGHDIVGVGMAANPSQGGAKHPCLEEISRRLKPPAEEVSRFLWGVRL